MCFLILLFFLTQICFSEESITINEYEATIELFYCPFNIKTVIPLSPETLIEHPYATVKQNIDENFYEEIKDYFTMIILEQPKPSVVKFPSLGDFPEREEIIPPYINTRLVIRLSHNRGDVLIAVGNSNTISINGVLFYPNNDFVTKVSDLLFSMNQYEINSDFVNNYKGKNTWR
jgi:hypothetical protein